jgi:transcriptional regulator with XRE-family HTH domain
MAQESRMNTRSCQDEEMKDEGYRHGMVNAQIEIDLPFQIRALRKQRGWTQPELAAKTGMKQPRISNMEKPGVTRFSLETLRRLAEAFDVALVVRFAPFSELLNWSQRFSPDDFAVQSFGDETERPGMPRGVPPSNPGNRVGSFTLVSRHLPAVPIRVAPAPQPKAA